MTKGLLTESNSCIAAVIADKSVDIAVSMNGIVLGTLRMHSLKNATFLKQLDMQVKSSY